ncbi:hypothetical protein G647_08150 [Cladophialophora carrionii CBS 160.54]|uniref:Uncharacterized protein n=1 Tax=Cladophialophora carrionii CBS 160.54 TaxID=1279043 RepID=V9D0C5_9EURO|nr:uncharacterized protein G647_08150 [Cladophialophora carrionii CBS 160.54]ETI20116.1 hypothetical protein G647_08150 [Cladophialophora carrionii CBS 160.54]
MFSTTFSSASSQAPRIYATAEEAEAAAANERRQAPSPRTKDDYATAQSKQRAEMILGQYDLLIKYAVENGVSIPQTRAYFRKVSLGIATEPIIKNWFS